MLRTSFTLCTGILVLLARVSPAAAGIMLGFDSLPSAQGWTYGNFGVHSGISENTVFAVAGGSLTMNTVGQGFGGPSSLGYSRLNVVDPALPWTLDWTLEVNGYEFFQGPPPFPDWDYGSGFNVWGNDYRVVLGISDDGVSVGAVGGAESQRAVRNNTSPQQFRLAYTPNAPAGTYQLFVDNALLLEGNAEAVSSPINGLFFGDGTGLANAEWTMTSYEFSQAVVAEPPALPMFLLMLVLSLAIGRRWQRRLSPANSGNELKGS